ncbi:hypothetical protein F0562_000759 [Nyssa sinensis]|uniref:Protein kinase domain-containing protein n=1 Tax=Nyssa sinensis TaxID=561372 RepID=A0A5J5C0Z6_9ASTE|nr:hypothetical protein F0562_000759 [Nyssa sinensis]
MSEFANLFTVSNGSGVLKKAQWLMLKQLLVLCYVLHITDANLPDDVLEAQLLSPTTVPLAAPAIPDLPLPANLPLSHKAHWKHFSPHGPRLSKPLMKKSGLVPPSAGLAPPRLADVAPTQSSAGTIPTGLAQPPLSPYSSNCCQPDMVLKRGSRGCHCVYPIKLDLLLLNVSSNWNLFLKEFASQLGLWGSQIELIDFYVLSLSRLNISMDITPHTGISFSASEASAINSSLSTHRVHLDPTLVGDYKLLNMTWFKPSAQSQAPLIAVSPAKASPHLPSTPSSLTEAAPKEPAKPRTVDAVPSAGSLPYPTSTRFLAYEELREATNNFEPASMLGEGGFGRVFKGVLSDGTAVAIKRLTNGGQQGDKEFLVEVEMLSRLHHRNLVKLVGYYSSRDSSQNLLCYELVPNGSLESWLHGPLGVNCPLDWDTRMKIALDAARGLAYLHEDSQPCVIHRDFKASNILLENNFHAKVADFGLAKQAPEGRANYLSTRVMGTFGYVAP